MKRTPNYEFPLYEGEDIFNIEEFNSGNEKIDLEIKRTQDKVETLGYSQVVIDNLVHNTVLGEETVKKLEEANANSSKLEEMINSTENVRKVITPSEWVQNGEYFEYVWVHNQNTTNINLTMYVNAGVNAGEIYANNAKVVDANTLLIRSETREEIAVILNTKHYAGAFANPGTLDVNSITQTPDKQFVNVNEKLNIEKIPPMEQDITGLLASVLSLQNSVNDLKTKTRFAILWSGDINTPSTIALSESVLNFNFLIIRTYLDFRILLPTTGARALFTNFQSTSQTNFTSYEIYHALNFDNDKMTISDIKVMQRLQNGDASVLANPHTYGKITGVYGIKL